MDIKDVLKQCKEETKLYYPQKNWFELSSILNTKKYTRFILDDNSNFYYIYKNKKEYSYKMIYSVDIIELLKQGAIYLYISKEGMFRALDFECDLYHMSLNKSKKYKFLSKQLSYDELSQFQEIIKQNKEFIKIKEEDLDIRVNISWEGFPYSYSTEKIKVHKVHLTHMPTGLTYSTDSNTGFDTGYRYALNKLEDKLNEQHNIKNRKDKL